MRDAAFPYRRVIQRHTRLSCFADHAEMNAARSIARSLVRIPTALR
jgi:hypothetical protein